MKELESRKRLRSPFSTETTIKTDTILKSSGLAAQAPIVSMQAQPPRGNIETDSADQVPTTYPIYTIDVVESLKPI